MHKTYLLLTVAAACACGQPVQPSPPLRTYGLDDVLRLNHLQARGTHNSYHLEPERVVDDSHRFSQPPLLTQLRDEGVRQLEFDLHLRRGRDGSEHLEVFHIPGTIDDKTTCLRFSDCLETIRRWSDATPWHTPVLVWLEPKNELAVLETTLASLEGRHDTIEAEIARVFPRDRLLTPDDVRRNHSTLREAITTEGWPTLGELRQKVIFALLDHEENRDAYLAAQPNLAGRLLFPLTRDTSAPYAALVKLDSARGHADELERAIAEGFLVTVTADRADLDDAANAAEAMASTDSGAHYISTDFPRPVPDRAYWFALRGAFPIRCNPITAPPECTPDQLE